MLRVFTVAARFRPLPGFIPEIALTPNLLLRQTVSLKGIPSFPHGTCWTLAQNSLLRRETCLFMMRHQSEGPRFFFSSFSILRRLLQVCYSTAVPLAVQCHELRSSKLSSRQKPAGPTRTLRARSSVDSIAFRTVCVTRSGGRSQPSGPHRQAWFSTDCTDQRPNRTVPSCSSSSRTSR